jgi:hypothetical protein
MHTMSQQFRRSAVVLMAALFSLTTLVSCGGSGGTNIQVPGVDGPHISLLEDSMVVNLTFESVDIEGGLRYQIPRYPNSWLEVSAAAEGGTNMVMSLALSDIMNGDLLLLDPQTLPGGRALPGVSTGSLPAVAFSIESFNNMTFYVGPEVFGFFVPASLGIDNGIATFRYYIGENRAGNISLVGNDIDGENSGLLLMLDLNSRNKRLLKRYMSRF